jgi:hypothetical protein
MTPKPAKTEGPKRRNAFVSRYFYETKSIFGAYQGFGKGNK